MAISSSSVSFGESLIPWLKAVKERGKDLREESTEKCAEILLREGFGLADEQFISQYKCEGGEVDRAPSYKDKKFALIQRNPEILL